MILATPSYTLVISLPAYHSLTHDSDNLEVQGTFVWNMTMKTNTKTHPVVSYEIFLLFILSFLS